MTNEEMLERRKAALSKITSAVDEYVDGYEFPGDDGDYTPSDTERFLIMDVIYGLLEDDDFKSAYTSAIEEKHQAQIAIMLRALFAAKMFIKNGVELGFIKMPDLNCQDPAHSTLPMIEQALSDTQATSDAFIAEVKALAEHDALEHAADYADEAHHGKISSSELRRIAAELRNQVQAEVVQCPNCDTDLPKGCGGRFKDEGHHCWLNRAQAEGKDNGGPGWAGLDADMVG